MTSRQRTLAVPDRNMDTDLSNLTAMTGISCYRDQQVALLTRRNRSLPTSAAFTRNRSDANVPWMM
jgi:hypothetical protein